VKKLVEILIFFVYINF